jgi:hypothetical protein
VSKRWIWVSMMGKGAAMASVPENAAVTVAPRKVLRCKLALYRDGSVIDDV